MNLIKYRKVKKLRNAKKPTREEIIFVLDEARSILLMKTFWLNTILPFFENFKISLKQNESADTHKI